MTRPNVALSAALLAALTGCGPLLTAELDVPEVRITLPSQSFPASSADPSDWCLTESCAAVPLQYDLATEVPIVDEPGVGYDLRLKRVGIVLTTSSAGTNLAGIQSAGIRIVEAGGGPGVLVASYTRDDAAPPPTTLSVTGDQSIDLEGYVTGGNLNARVELVYDDPTPAFSADVSAAFELGVDVDWGEYL